MTTRSLLILILKILGLFFAKDFLPLIPQLISVFVVFIGYYGEAMFSPFIASLLTVFLYGYIAYSLLFRTEWIIEKLRLEEGIENESWSVKLHRSAILQISIIIIGALMVAHAGPDLLRQVFLHFQYVNKQGSLIEFNPKPDYTVLIVYGAQIIIGLLLLGYQRKLAVYIEYRRRTPS